MRSIPLMVPDLPNAEALLPHLRRIDHHRWYTNFGPLVQEFEHALASMLSEDNASVPYVVTSSNATVALELCLQAMSLPKGARVLVPGLTFVATATAVVRAGLTPVIADIDPDTWLLTPELATQALSQTVFDAVLPVAAFGCPQNIEAWALWQDKHDIPVLIDAAGAFGNQRIGHIPSVFSLHATKSLGIGEGGFIASTNTKFIEHIRCLSNFGIGDNHGAVLEAGTNGKMSEYHAAVALAALPHWLRRKALRIHLQKVYQTQLMAKCPEIQFQLKPDTIPTLLPIGLPKNIDAGTVATDLARLGIATRRWYCPPIFEHPAFQTCSLAGDLPICRDLGKRLIGLPFHLELSEQDISYVCCALTQTIEGLSRIAHTSVSATQHLLKPMTTGSNAHQ